MKTFRLVLSIVIGIIAFLVIRENLIHQLGLIGIETFIDYGKDVCVQRGFGRASWDECMNGAGTDISFFFGTLAAVIAVGIGNIVLDGKFPPFSTTDKGKKVYAAWLIGSLLISMTSVFIALIFSSEYSKWINFAIAAAVAYFGFEYVKKLREGE